MSQYCSVTRMVSGVLKFPLMKVLGKPTILYDCCYTRQRHAPWLTPDAVSPFTRCLHEPDSTCDGTHSSHKEHGWLEHDDTSTTDEQANLHNYDSVFVSSVHANEYCDRQQRASHGSQDWQHGRFNGIPPVQCTAPLPKHALTTPKHPRRSSPATSLYRGAWL